MSLPPLPKKPRSFLCTKCGGRTCEGSIDVPHPVCICGYLGFAADEGHTDAAMQVYGQQCREDALEEAAIDAERYGHVWSGEPAHAFFELAEDIRSMK